MLGYKIAQNKDFKRVLVTLEIPKDAKTNLNRRYIANKYTSKYRCNKAKVLKIEDEIQEYQEANSIYDNTFIYIVGEDVVEKNYDEQNEVICGKGLHFFLDKQVALFYDLDISKMKEGVYCQYYDDGQKMIEFIYKDGKRDGLCRIWHENGKLKEECLFKKGKKEGLYKSWWSNGKTMVECNYLEGKKVGIYKEFNKKGYIEYETTYCSPWSLKSSEMNKETPIVKTKLSIFDKIIIFLKKCFH